MNERLFLNTDVIAIAKLEQRQIINWAEKGLIIPFKDADGAGSRREYTYINLLEFRLVKYLLDDIGLRLRRVKLILSQLRGKVFVSDDKDVESVIADTFLIVVSLKRIRKEIDNALTF